MHQEPDVLGLGERTDLDMEELEENGKTGYRKGAGWNEDEKEMGTMEKSRMPGLGIYDCGSSVWRVQ